MAAEVLLSDLHIGESHPVLAQCKKLGGLCNDIRQVFCHSDAIAKTFDVKFRTA